MKIININSPEDFKVVKFNLANGGFGIISNLDLEKLGDKNWTYYKAVIYFFPGTKGRKRIRLKESLEENSLYHVLDGNRKNLIKENINPIIYDDGKNFYVRRVVLIGEEYKESEKIFPYKNDRESQLERAIFYRKELFRIKKELFFKSQEVPNWELDGSIVRIPLGDGTFALLDEKYLNYAKPYSWKYNERYGVIAYDNSQRISLHNLIAPFPKTTFKNRNKRDCRRSNLEKLAGFPSNIVNGIRKSYCEIRHNTEKRIYFINRFANYDGKKMQTTFSFPYGPKKKYPKEQDAFQAAQEAFPKIRGMTKEEISDRVIANKKSCVHDIIKDWSVFDDKVFSRSSVFRQHGNQENTGFQIK